MSLIITKGARFWIVSNRPSHSPAQLRDHNWVSTIHKYQFQSIQFHCWSIFSIKCWLKISNFVVQENAPCACLSFAWRAAKHPMEMPSARKSHKETLVVRLVRSSKWVARTINMATGTMRFSRQCSRSQDQKGINKLISFFLRRAVHIKYTYFIKKWQIGNNKLNNTVLGKWF